ncbi:hypothetical protein [Evansella clarkii]|uniref:hypothetical protein n=1 Tax=Evansella clarkii TaxID=79879 RepID=UPI0009967A16|nr:hypothetical protein [Evansella clarkii]
MQDERAIKERSGPVIIPFSVIFLVLMLFITAIGFMLIKFAGRKSTKHKKGPGFYIYSVLLGLVFITLTYWLAGGYTLLPDDSPYFDGQGFILVHFYLPLVCMFFALFHLLKFPLYAGLGAIFCFWVAAFGILIIGITSM